MAGNDIGIGISIKINKITISDKEINKIKKEINNKLDGKLKADISFNFNKENLNKMLSKIRQNLKANPLKIELKTFINQGAINAQIQGLQNKLKSLNIGAGTDNNKNAVSQTKDNNAINKTNTTITKELDGSITKVTQSFDKMGNIVEEVTKKIDKQKQKSKESSDQQQKEIKQLTGEYTKFGKVIQTIENKNAKGVTTGFQRTSKNEKTGLLTTEHFRAGQESAYKIVNNIEQIEKAEKKAQEQIRNAILKTEQTRRKEVEKSAQAQGKAANKAADDAHKAQQAEKLRVKRLGEKVTSVGRINFNADDAELKRYAQVVAGAGAEVGKVTPKIDSMGRRIREVNVRVNEGGTHWRNYRMTLDQTSRSLYRTDRGLSDVRNRQISFNEALKIAVTRIAQWGIATSLVYGSLQKLREGLQTLKEIDTELINIAKVTEYTNQQMKELTQTAIKTGKEFGRTAQEYLKAVTTFARAGMGQQSEEYAKLSLLLQNVGDITAETANETLIAANAGFQLSGNYEALMNVIDKFNNISNKNATNIEKLSEAMKVGASVFHSAGMSIDETISIIGTATASTQRSGSEISRAWRTILMNIRQVSDEEAEVTEESMKKAEKALNSVGIIVRDTPSTFRPMFEIVRDLGNEWNNLSEVEQAYVAESLAGKRQANVLISTLQNWNMAEKQLQESISASGSALRENEVYMQSWEARAKQLNNTITEFWSHFINTDAVKSSISSLTAIINVFDKLINNSFTSFLLQTGLITTAITLLIIGFNALKFSLAATAIGVIALDVAEKGLIVTTKALTTTLLASPLFWTVGILSIIKAVDALTISFKEQKVIVDNLSSEINNLQTEYDQLNNKENRTSEEEKYLRLLEKELEIKKELNNTETIKLMDEEFFDTDLLNSNGIDKVNGYITLIKNLKEELSNAETKEEADELKERILDFEEKLINSQKSILNYKDALGEIPPELQALADAIDAILNTDNSEPSKTVDKTKESTSNLNSELKALQTTMTNSISNIESYQKALDEYNESGKFNLKTIIELAEEQPQLLKMLDDETAIREELISIIEQEQETARSAYVAMIQDSEDFYNTKILGNATLVSELESDYQIDLKNYKSLAAAKLEVEKNLLREIAGDWADFYNIETQGLNEKGEFLLTYAPAEGYAMLEALSKYRKESEEIEDRFRNIVLNTTKIDFNKIGLNSSKTKSSKDPINPYITDQYAQSIQELDKQYTEIEGSLLHLDKTSSQYLNKQKQLISILKQKQQIAHEEAEKLRNVINPELENQIGIIDKQIEKVGGFNNLSEKQQKLYNDLNKELDDNNKTINQLSSSWWDLEQNIKSANDEIKNIKQSLAQDIIQIYKDVYQKQKEIALDAKDKEIEVEEERHDDQMEHLDEELSAYEEIIDAKLKLIDETESKEDYTKQLTKAQKERQEIQNKINVLSLDDSIEARQQLFELNEELTNKDEEIEEMKHKHTVDLRKKNLKDQLDNYKKDIDEKKDLENDKYNKTKERLKNEKEAIEASWNDRINSDRTWTALEERIMDGHFDDISDIFDDFIIYIKDNSGIIGQSLSENLIDKIKEFQQILNNLPKTIKLVENGITYESIDGTIYKDGVEVSKENYKYIPKEVGGTREDSTSITPSTPSTSTSSSNRFNIGGNEYAVDDNGTIFKKGEDGKYHSVPAENFKYIPDEVLNTAKDIKSTGVNVKQETSTITSTSSTHSSTSSSSSNTSSSSSSSSPSTSTSSDNKFNIGGNDYAVDDKGGVYKVKDGAYSYVPAENFKYIPDEVLNAAKDIKSKHDGGIVGQETGTSSKIVELVNKLFNTKPNEQIVKMLKNELAIPQHNIPNFMDNIQNLVSSLSPASVVANGGNIYNLNLRIDNVTGNKNGGQQVFKEVVNGLKKMGV